MDGREDFDFLFGSWVVANRKLRDPLDRGCEEWVEFPATVTSRPVIGGLGNVDDFSAPTYPGHAGYEGMALRLFEPKTGLWRIWWAANARPGGLDTPLVGRFDGEVGTFECDDTIDSRDLRIRFQWWHTADDTGLPRWRQSFRFAGESDWVPNWQMDLTRS
jgi:hypothetical protein